MDKQMYVDFNKRPDLWRVEGAETFAQVRDRTLEGIRRIAAENPGGTVAAASHGAALRTLLGTLQGMSLEEIGQTGHGDNTAVSLLEVEGDDIRVVFRDDASHLPAAVSTFRRQSWHKDDAATEPGLWFRPLEGPEAAERLAAAWAEAGEQGPVPSASLTLEGLLNEEPAGLLHLAPETGQIHLTYIRPDCRRRGLGVQLLGQAVRHTRERGGEELSAAASPGGPGGAFLRDCGFVPQGEAEGRRLWQKPIGFDPSI